MATDVKIYIDPKYSAYVDEKEARSIYFSTPYAVPGIQICYTDDNIVRRVCPPIEFLTLEALECLKGVLSRFEEEFKERPPRPEEYGEWLNRIWKRIDECPKRVYLACACYVREPPLEIISELKERNVDLALRPTIFVSVDCLRREADDIEPKLELKREDAFRIQHELTLLHETYHAFTDAAGKKYQWKEAWYRIMEESLAEFHAWKFSSSMARRSMPYLSRDAPLEYQTWRVWAWLGQGAEPLPSYWAWEQPLLWIPPLWLVLPWLPILSELSPREIFYYWYRFLRRRPRLLSSRYYWQSLAITALKMLVKFLS